MSSYTIWQRNLIKLLAGIKRSSKNKSNQTLRILCSIILVLGSAIACVDAGSGQAVTFTTTQLTNNDVDDLNPRISGSNIVWQSGKFERYDVLFYSENQTRRLTNGKFNNINPQIYDNYVVWQSTTDKNIDSSEIFLFDGKTIRQLTKNRFYDTSPQIFESSVVWNGYTTGAESTAGVEVFYFNGEKIEQLTKDASLNLDPQISPDYIGWIRSHPDSNYTQDEIFIRGDRERIVKTNKFTKINSLRTSGRNIVWSGFDGQDLEIFLYDGNRVRQLTDNDVPDLNPQISGNNVVWQGGVASSQEIFFYNGKNVEQVTENDFNDINPQISGSNIVWSGFENKNYEIFFYNGERVKKISNNKFDDVDPQISGLNIVWSGIQNLNDSEIFIATPDEEQSASTSTIAIAVLGVVLLVKLDERSFK